MNIGDAVYMTTDGRIHAPKKPGRLQRLKLFIGRKFNIKRWQPKGPFIGLALETRQKGEPLLVVINGSVRYRFGDENPFPGTYRSFDENER